MNLYTWMPDDPDAVRTVACPWSKCRKDKGVWCHGLTGKKTVGIHGQRRKAYEKLKELQNK